MKGFDGAVLVIFGDNPIITKETYQMAADKVKEGYAVVVLGFRPADAARYGRLVMENGELKKIVEFKDASDEEKAINLCNSGCMCFDGKTMFELLEAIGNENAAGEYYLTDAGCRCPSKRAEMHGGRMFAGRGRRRQHPRRTGVAGEFLEQEKR